ncbi:uncharacterized protein LOC126899039 [Daktulosphaira vitifoliae]|uniref:uncharacterized protein LOC126899039 n=1 Tax=Daktulosphaira vitifoliae TaxID=58002 RepID=UPI0021AA6AB2|nr:uncharacterized protein LOC126899039 [Daktulosphaira vitifoliae]
MFLNLLSKDLVNVQNRLVKDLLQLTPQMNCNELSKKCLEHITTLPMGTGTVTTTKHGTIGLQLPYDVSVELTLDGSVRLTNRLLNLAVAFNEDNTKSALLHSIGTIYQTDKTVEIRAKDLIGHDHKSVKLFPAGACFTSTSNCLVYIIDEAGVRSTINPFKIASNDFSLDVFFANCRHGPTYVEECNKALAEIKHAVTQFDTHIWRYKDIVVSQTKDGSTRILKNLENEIRMSPQWNAVSIISPHIHCSASISSNSNGALMVSRGSHSVNYNGQKLTVHYKKIASGFDDSGQVAIY